ncbi:DoxX family protein [Variovorax sp. HW608]|uniref:DoxX family protein n=1 Tax=Variovorax sp. HW608 TaxID=1034889 RepID=UPI0012FD1BC3|nr:DoxX family protein [Variovorax sp. HW608]
MKQSSTRSDRIRLGASLFLALTFCVTGSMMLLGVPVMVELFDRVGIGQWFRYVTGGLEIVGSGLLMRAATRLLGALLLFFIMGAAIATHLFVIGGYPVSAIVLGAACGWVFLGERKFA